MAFQPRFLDIPESRLELSEKAVELRGSVDEIDFVDGMPGLVRHVAPQVAAIGAPFRVRGWALDVGQRQLGEELAFEIGPNRTTAGFDEDRPDIANAFDSPTLSECGFRAGVPTTGLTPGQYGLRASMRLKGDDIWYVFASAVVYLAAEASLAPALSHEQREKGRVELRGGIDALDDFGKHRSAQLSGPFPVAVGTALVVRGWMFHPEDSIRSIRARLGELVVSGWIGYPRADVAAMLGRSEAASSGFVVPIRLSSTPPGVYRLSIECETALGWIGFSESRDITVLPEAEEFPTESRMLREPLRATIARYDREIESGTIVRFAGTIETRDFAAAYLEIRDASVEGDGEPKMRYFSLSYPVLIDGVPQFALELTGRELKRGRYEARVVATTPDRRAYRAAAQKVQFDVIASRSRRR